MDPLRRFGAGLAVLTVWLVGKMVGN